MSDLLTLIVCESRPGNLLRGVLFGSIVLFVPLMPAVAGLPSGDGSDQSTDSDPISLGFHDWIRLQTELAASAWDIEFEQTLASGDWARRAARLRAELLEAIGGLPSTRTDLNARVQRVRAMPGYRIETVRYESRPGFVVTATFYLPDGASPDHRVPGVLIPCGHAGVAKAWHEYQAAGALLALNGLAALVYDPIDQGERIQRFDPGGGVINEGVSAHMQAGMAALLLGWNLAQVRVWDGIRSLDYLAGRPEVDPARLGVTGHSGGGNMTCLLSALDPRLRAAAPCCYVGRVHPLRGSWEGAIDSEQIFFGQLALGFEHADFFLARSAMPVLLLAATQDTGPIEDTWQTFRILKRAYANQDVSEWVDIVEDNVGHSYSLKHRESMVAWMLRQLTGEERSVREPAIEILSENDLFATPEGRVLELPGARSIWDLYRDESARLAEQRGHPTGQELRRRIRAVTGIVDDPLAPLVIEGGAVARAPPGYRCHAVTLSSADRRISLPLFLFRPSQSASNIPVLVASPESAEELMDSSPQLEQFFRERRTIAVFNPFGTGQAHRYGEEPGGLGNDEWVALYMLGTTAVRYRAEDLLLAARYLTDIGAASDGRLDLVAEGATAVPALHAAVLEPNLFSGVTLRGMPERWSEFFTLERSYAMNDTFIHGVLHHYDLPDLVAALGSLVSIESPVNLLGLAPPLPALPAAEDLDRATLPGLIGIAYGGGDLSNPRTVDSLRQLSGDWQNRSGSWSAEWQGFILGPVDGEVVFEGTTNRRMEVIINDRMVLSRADFPGTAVGRAVLRMDESTPIVIRFLQNEGRGTSSFSLHWTWEGHARSLIDDPVLRHSRRQLDECRIAVRR